MNNKKLLGEKEKEYYLINESAPSSFILAGFISVVLFVLHYVYARDTLRSGITTDLSCHMEFASQFEFPWEHFRLAWIRVPYMFWHILVKGFVDILKFPLQDASAMVYSIFALFNFGVVSWIIYSLVKHYTGNRSMKLALLGGFLISLVGPLEKWWYAADIYYGQFSPNPFHNPTHMAVKGFGMLCFALGVDIFRDISHDKPIFFASNHVLWFGVFLFLSTITKPTFMYMLLPAGAIYILILICVSLVSNPKNCIYILKRVGQLFLVAIPSILYLLLEYMAFYTWGTEQYTSSVVIGHFLETWHLYAYDVPTSIMLAMCFPIWICITNPRYFLMHEEGLFAVICYFVGVFEFAFIQESGGKMAAANFAWCMMAGMVVLFTISTSELITVSIEQNSRKRHVLYVCFSWFLLFLHVVSGYLLMSEFIVTF